MILLGLGANLSGLYGSPEAALQACPALLSDFGIHVLDASYIWESAPVPISDQPWYKNAVCSVETKLSAAEVISAIGQTEAEAGRVRTVVNAPRVLDIDLLCYHDEVIEAPHIQIPHPRMHERAFVMFPLKEVAPHWQHPILHKSVDDLIKELPQGQEIRMSAHHILSTHTPSLKKGA